MTEETKSRKALSVKNLAELKRIIKPGAELLTTAHSKHPDMVGLVRVVSEVQSNAFYSKIKDQPEHKFSTSNDGRGFRTDFEKASDYIFDGTTVKVLDARKRDESVLFEFQIYDREMTVKEQSLVETEETMHLTCLNCEYEFDGRISLDDLGWHSSCPECGSSFDVDAPERRFVIAFADQSDPADPYKNFTDKFTGQGVATLHCFATAEEFIDCWTRLAKDPEDMWYCCLDTYAASDGHESGVYCLCSGACDPGDIDIFANYPPLSEAAKMSEFWVDEAEIAKRSAQQNQMQMGGIS